MANVSQIKLPNGTTYDIKDTISGYITDAGVTGVKGNAETTYRTGQVNLTAANIGAVAKSGDTMTGLLTTKGNVYDDAYTGALNLANSNIYGVNSIYTADVSDDSKQGIHFYRSATTVDSVHAKSGILYFTPNRTLGSVGTSYQIYHSGNLTGDAIMGGYINTHPENSPVIIPFIHNDIAFLLKRGGSAIVRHNGTEVTKDLTNAFDGSSSYCSYSAADLSNITTIEIELTLHTNFSYSSWLYIDFGNVGWRAKSVKFEVMNSNYTNDTWTQKYNTTNNTLGHIAFSTSHAPSGGSTANGFNKIKITLSSWNSTQFRISQIGVYNYGSLGVRQTYMSRGMDDPVFRSITPYSNNTYSLGSSSNKWANVYATTFAGNLSGIADKAKKIIDANNNSSEITIEYSSGGISSASWFPAFSGYAIKPISAANVRSSIGALASSEKGAANGVVPLNASSKIDSTYLPSYVDDVLEYNGTANFPSTGEAGKIYVDTSTNKTYRWGGSSYTEISQGSIVSVSRSLTSGTKSATITVNGTGYDIYSTNNDDTKNTAGSTNTSSKIFLIGATSQAANPQTYSHDTAYVGTDGKLYSASKVVLVGGSNASSSVTITPTTTDVYSMTSAGSVTAGTKASFTRGTFSQGTLPTMTWTMDSTDTKKLNITFSQGTLPTHAADSFTANTPTAVTLPGRSSSAIKVWTGYSAATAAAQAFTGVTG